MYEQFLSFWFIWIIFIIIVFFMQSGRKRSFLLLWILFMLFIFEIHFMIFSIQISLAFIILFIGAFIFYVYDSISIYKLIVTFIVMIGYVSISLWEKVTPIWFFMPSYLLIPVVIVMLVIILVHAFNLQLTTALVGITLGQMLFEIILIVYKLYIVVGDEVFFIHSSLTMLLLIAVRFFHLILNGMSQYVKNKINLTNKLL